MIAMKRSAAKKIEGETVSIPVSVFETAQTKEDLEDWLLAHDSNFVREMKRIQTEEDLAGKGVSLEEAADKWHIKL